MYEILKLETKHFCFSVTDSLLRNFQMEVMGIAVVNGGPRETYFSTQRGTNLSQCLSRCFEKELLYTMWCHMTTVTCGALGSETIRSVLLAVYIFPFIFCSLIWEQKKGHVNKKYCVNKIDEKY